MGDSAFLDDYDPARYDRPSVAVDLVALGIVGGWPAVLLTRRDDPPFAGAWALPGGFVAIDESLDTAAVRVLAVKAGLRDVAVDQVHSFGAVGRDPRMRIISVAYRALLSPDRIAAITTGDDRMLVPIDRDGTIRVDGRPLAFDHGDIVAATLHRLRCTIDDDAFALLPDPFTLRDLQAVHEAILGYPRNKPAFRRRMLDSGRIAATGARETGTAFRPAAHYTRIPKD